MFPSYNAHHAGKSSHGEYGDAVEETDWAIAQIEKTLDDLGLSDNTLVIFASDNGGDQHNVDGDGNVVGGWNGGFRGGNDGMNCFVPICIHTNRWQRTRRSRGRDTRSDVLQMARAFESRICVISLKVSNKKIMPENAVHICICLRKHRY